MLQRPPEDWWKYDSKTTCALQVHPKLHEQALENHTACLNTFYEKHTKKAEKEIKACLQITIMLTLAIGLMSLTNTAFIALFLLLPLLWMGRPSIYKLENKLEIGRVIESEKETAKVLLAIKSTLDDNAFICSKHYLDHIKEVLRSTVLDIPLSSILCYKQTKNNYRSFDLKLQILEKEFIENFSKNVPEDKIEMLNFLIGTIPAETSMKDLIFMTKELSN